VPRQRPGHAGVRLTRRGRLVVSVVTLAVTVAVGVCVVELASALSASGEADVGSGIEPGRTTAVMVRPGHTGRDVGAPVAFG
jgi:hypothetical protein